MFLQRRAGSVEEAAEQIRVQVLERNEVAEERKRFWKRVAELEAEHSAARQTVEKAHRQLQRSMPRHMSRGLEYIQVCFLLC